MSYETIISSVGFPIGVTIILLYMMNTTLKDNTEAMRDLKAVIKAKLK